MILDLDGPRLPAASGNPPRRLVVFLHGYGADGNDLIALGREWARALPDVAFAAPNAPEPCAANPAGFQWFELTLHDPHEMWRGVNQAAPALDAFLNRELARHGLSGRDLALVGFSQGTMMALHVGLRRPETPAAIVGFSGALAGPEHLKGEATGKPPILLVHGDRDEIIPFQAMFIAGQSLAATGLAVQWHLSPGLGHGIDGAGLELAGSFLKRTLTTSI